MYLKTARDIHTPSISVCLLWNDIYHEMKLSLSSFPIWSVSVMCNWPIINTCNHSMFVSLMYLGFYRLCGLGEVTLILCSILRISLYRQVGGFLLVLRFPPAIKLITTIYRYMQKIKNCKFLDLFKFQTTRKLVVFYIWLCLILSIIDNVKWLNLIKSIFEWLGLLIYGTNNGKFI